MYVYCSKMTLLFIENVRSYGPLPDYWSTSVSVLVTESPATGLVTLKVIPTYVTQLTTSSEKCRHSAVVSHDV